MRLLTALLLTVAIAAVALTSTAGAQREQVTLRVERFWSDACKCHKYRFSGTISSGAANEYVAILQQVCGKTFSTAIAGASTRAGGFWEAESNGPVGTGTFRARWDNHLSDAVTYRAELSILTAQLGGGRVRVSVSSFGVKLKGNLVELQRLAAGQWTPLRRARFSARRPGSFRHVHREATRADAACVRACRERRPLLRSDGLEDVDVRCGVSRRE